MGKKPVLGLVGLWVGLTLSGCKDCNCAFWRKDPEKLSVRDDKHAGMTEGGDQVSTLRRRSVPDQSVANKGLPPRGKPAHDHPVDSWAPPPSKPSPGVTHNSAPRPPVEETPISTGIVSPPDLLAVPDVVEPVNPALPTSMRKPSVPAVADPMTTGEVVVPPQQPAPRVSGPIPGATPPAVPVDLPPALPQVGKQPVDPRSAPAPAKVEETISIPTVEETAPAMPDLSAPGPLPAPESMPAPLPAPEVLPPGAAPELPGSATLPVAPSLPAAPEVVPGPALPSLPPPPAQEVPEVVPPAGEPAPLEIPPSAPSPLPKQ